MDCLTLHLPHRLKTLPLPSISIVAMSCLLCMDFDCSRGGLHSALTSHTSTQIIYMGAPKGRKNYLPSEDLLIKFAVRSCQPFHVRSQFSAWGYTKEWIQAKECHSVMSITSRHYIYHSYPKNRVLSMFVCRDHFIWILNVHNWCQCQELALR